jgi:filamentous hemagglutinin
VLKDGYYEVNGLKFSEYYYNKLWSTGRGAPSLVANEILASGAKGVPDAVKAGFFRYISGGWEMVFNPTTKEVWHLQPLR